MGKQLARHSRIFSQNAVRFPKGIGRTHTEVAEVADRRCYDVQTRGKRFVHQTRIKRFQLKRKRVRVKIFISLGRGR